jgi:hypothetical protein
VKAESKEEKLCSQLRRTIVAGISASPPNSGISEDQELAGAESNEFLSLLEITASTAIAEGCASKRPRRLLRVTYRQYGRFQFLLSVTGKPHAGHMRQSDDTDLLQASATVRPSYSPSRLRASTIPNIRSPETSGA